MLKSTKVFGNSIVTKFPTLFSQKYSNSLSDLKNYRYPFTPFPRGWYYLVPHKKNPLKEGRGYVCGQNIYLEKDSHGSYSFARTENQKKVPLTFIAGHPFVYIGHDKPFINGENLPKIAEFKNSGWGKPFHLQFKARVHIQEVAENALDLAHFNRIHDYLEEPTLEYFVIDGYSFTVTLKAKRKILGVLDEPVMTITYFGLGLVIADITSKMISLKVLLTSTPVDEDHIVINHWISVKKRNFIFDKALQLYLPGIIYRDFKNDIPIWENKIYREHPCVTLNEKNILKIRQWAKQFF